MNVLDTKEGWGKKGKVKGKLCLSIVHRNIWNKSLLPSFLAVKKPLQVHMTVNIAIAIQISKNSSSFQWALHSGHSQEYCCCCSNPAYRAGYPESAWGVLRATFNNNELDWGEWRDHTVLGAELKLHVHKVQMCPDPCAISLVLILVFPTQL